MNKLNKILIPVAIIIAGLAIAGSFLYINKTSSGILSTQQAAEKAMNYINQNLLQTGTTASLMNVIEEDGVYKLHFKIGNNEYDSYVTKNGKLFFIDALDIEANPTNATTGEQTTGEVSKSDAPDVKLFVMSYCPYGLQAEKMYLSVYNLLKDKLTMGIYFVNYIMHDKKELDENLRQYCIQKEDQNKYYTYLSCFVKSGNSEACLVEAQIDKNKLNSCISETDKQYNITQSYNDKSTWLNGTYPKFEIYTDLNEKYGVKGSPTIVINDTVVEVNPRSPEKFKEVICQAFNSPPQECNQTLSNNAFSSGFGETSSATSSGGGCGQ